MAEKTLKEIIPEITEDQVRALEAAGITSPAGLAAMNVEVTAARTQLPAQTLAAWKLKAEQAPAQPSAKVSPKKAGARATARRIGWLLLALVWVVGIFLVWFGVNRVRRAQELRTTILAPLMQWMRYGAERALASANDARVPIKSQNFGAAQEALRKAQELVSLMRDTAPEAERANIRRAERLLSEAGDRLPDDPDGALRLLDDFAVAMADLDKTESD